MQKNEVKWNSENFTGPGDGEQLDSHGRQPRATATGDSHGRQPRATATGDGAGRRGRATATGPGAGRRGRATGPGDGAGRRGRATGPGDGAGGRGRATGPGDGAGRRLDVTTGRDRKVDTITTSLIQGISQTELLTRMIDTRDTGNRTGTLLISGIDDKPVTTVNMLTNQMIGRTRNHGQSPSIVRTGLFVIFLLRPEKPLR